MFNHRNGCQKCFTVGQYSKEFHRMSFGNIDNTLRTNRSFRDRIQPIHHKENSPFERLDIDMIKAFPTSDPLHLLDLGVMRRCLYRWVFGEKKYSNKWSKALSGLVSRLLMKCQTEKPTEFHRAIRTIDCLKHWKGLEYRTMLLYTGSVVLKRILPQSEYDHFLLLFVGVRLLCNSGVYKNRISIAKKCFKHYVQLYGTIYGNHSIGSNVHNLLHVTDDMESSGVCNLMEISTYNFENRLRLLGMDMKHTNLPLEQVVCRTSERNNLQYSKIQIKLTPFEPRVFYETYLNNRLVYKKIEIEPNVFLSARKKGDYFFLTSSKKIVKFVYAIKDDGLTIFGQEVKEKGPFFRSPLTSTKIDIYLSNGILENDIKPHGIASIQAKMVCLSSESEFVFMPLLSTLKNI